MWNDMTSIVSEESDRNVKSRQTSGPRSFKTILVRLLSSVLMPVINNFRCSYRGKLNLFDYCIICSTNVWSARLSFWSFVRSIVNRLIHFYFTVGSKYYFLWKFYYLLRNFYIVILRRKKKIVILIFYIVSSFINIYIYQFLNLTKILKLLLFHVE